MLVEVCLFVSNKNEFYLLLNNNRCKTWPVITSRLIVRYVTCEDAWPPSWNLFFCSVDMLVNMLHKIKGWNAHIREGQKFFLCWNEYIGELFHNEREQPAMHRTTDATFSATFLLSPFSFNLWWYCPASTALYDDLNYLAVQHSFLSF